MEEWIEEFLFRGRPPTGPGSDGPPTFHLVIGRQADSPFPGEAKQRQLLNPMTPEQADAAGWPLSKIIEGINTDAIAHGNALATALAEKEGLLEQSASALDGAEKSLAKAFEELEAVRVENKSLRQSAAKVVPTKAAAK